jgi:hypothetical protein
MTMRFDIIETNARASARWRAARKVLAVSAVASLLAGIPACSGLLDVDNPNNIAEESLNNAKAANEQANGVQASTVRMIAAIATPYATATDELDWIGSRDAWLDLEKGAISNYLNEFTDGAFPYVGEARYMGDETIKRLEGFVTQGALTDQTPLARTYLYTAITYTSIADMWDDFAFSNKTVPAKPVGRANMGSLYDTAIGYLNKALAIPGISAELRYDITAYRARAKHGKAVWGLISPEGKAVPANVLINDAGASADATSALGLKAADGKFLMVSNIEAQPGITIWFEVNGRNETKIGDAYSTLLDPITAAADPTSKKLIDEFKAYGSQDGVFTITSNREMHLILAEAALAAGNTATFTTEINAVRTLDGLPNWTGAAGQPTAQVILRHERKANLYLQRRRLADMYRFQEKATQWANDPNFKSAFSTYGLLFPIPNIERLANPCIANPGGC